MRLNELKTQGYELVVKPKVIIGGREPEPDFLFIKKDGADYILDDCIYIDNKYFHDVPFTAAQNEIVKPFISGGTEANVVTASDIRVSNDNSIIIAGSKLKIKKVEIFTIKNDFNLGKINKP